MSTRWTVDGTPTLRSGRGARASIGLAVAALLAVVVACAGPGSKKALEGSWGPEERREAEAAVDRLVELYEEGATSEVRALADSLLDVRPPLPGRDRVLLVLAQNELYEENPQAAIEHSRRLLENHPGSDLAARAAFIMGEAYRATGDAYLAAASYLRSAEAASDSTLRRTAESRAHELVHSRLEAEELERLAVEFPRSDISSSIRYRIARKLYAEGRFDESVESLVDFLSLHPSSPMAPEARKLLRMARERAGTSPRAVPDVSPRRIGVLAPLSGRFSVYGDAFLKGCRLAVEGFNVGREIPVQMRLGDSGGDPLQALRAVERLIVEEGVIGICGPVLSVPTISAAARAQCYGVPLVSTTATQEGIADIGDFVFQNRVPREAEITAVLTLAVRDLLLERVAVLLPSQGKGAQVAAFCRDEVERLGGEVAALESFEEGATDFTEPLERIRDVSPDALLVVASAEELLLILPQIRFLDIEAQLLGPSSFNTERLLRLSAQEMEGAIFPSDIYSGRSREEYERFQSLYRDAHHEDPNPVAVRAYFGAQALLEAIEAGAGTREEVRDRLEALARSRNHPLSRIRQAEALDLLTVRDGRVVPFVMPTEVPGRAGSGEREENP
jgi:branched-chain amino acid transport system substrate-binding protein